MRKFAFYGRNLERFPDADVSFRLVLQYAWKYYSRNSASHEISGAAYILYLAWQTWRRLPPSDQVQEKMPTWKLGFFLQMINVKIIIYGLTMFSAYILPYESKVPVLFIFAVYLMILGAFGNLLWAFAGNVLKTLYGQHYRIMNGIMALLLVWCSLRIVGVL